MFPKNRIQNIELAFNSSYNSTITNPLQRGIAYRFTRSKHDNPFIGNFDNRSSRGVCGRNHTDNTGAAAGESEIGRTPA